MGNIGQIYDEALRLAGSYISFRVTLVAFLVALGLFFAFLALSRLIELRFGRALAIGAGAALLAFFLVRGNVPAKVDDMGNRIANQAINVGVDEARKLQATEEQYIHAAVVKYGVDQVQCERKVNSRDFCSDNTPYYTHREINVRNHVHESCSGTGKDRRCTTSNHRHYDDEYTPWFQFVNRYWIVPDTKAKYLDERVYQGEGTGNDRPKIFLHNDWRAPVNAHEHLYLSDRTGRYETPGQYTDRVPEFWTRVQNAAFTGGPVVVATFVGHYFHWAHAAEAEQFATYNDYYVQLAKMTQLPLPTGAVFTVKNPAGKEEKLHTMLTSTDGDLPLDFPEVFTIGCNNIDANKLNQRAIEFQGHFGPNKEASARWFLVCDSIVNKLGGIIPTTQALKAYLNDAAIWGHFKLPKNQVILVASISDDGTKITGLNMETGMPFGNTLVMQYIRMHIEPGKPVPFSPDNLFGSFSGKYTPTESGDLTYTFSDMTAAKAAIGLLYQSTPNWTPPDLNSEECSTAPAEHLGFIRYQMCTQEFRKTSIVINEDGKQLIMKNVISDSQAATPVWFGWLAFGLGFAFIVGIFIAESQR